MNTTKRHLAFLLAFGFVLRLLLLLLFPAAYGDDGVGRIYFKDFLFLGHWLPLTQALVFLVARLSEHILAIRLLFALVGALAACGFYLFLRTLVRPPLALFGGLLFSVNSLYVVLSLMPYQDVLFLGLLYPALAAFSESRGHRSTTGGVLFGLASLTRYESWFLLPFLVAWKSGRQRHESRAPLAVVLLRSVLFFGWGPLLWFGLSEIRWGAWNSFLFQTADRTFYAWHPHFDIPWMLGYLVHMGYWLLRFGTPLILLAVPGLVYLVQQRRQLHRGLWFLLVLGLLVLIFFFAIIGKGFGTVNRFAMIPLSICLVLTVIGLEQTVAWVAVRWPRFQNRGTLRLLAGALLSALVFYSALTVQRLVRRPEFDGPYRAARFLDRHLAAGRRALVVAARAPDLTDAAPMAYQRLVIQTRWDREHILCSALLPPAEPDALLALARRKRVKYLVVFPEPRPWSPADRFFLAFLRDHSSRFKHVSGLASADIFEVIFWER